MWFKRDEPNLLLSETFKLAGGSVIGRDHRKAGRNNQDAYAWGSSGDVIVAAVSDGCGSSPHSEVGAWITARLIVEFVVNRIQRFAVDDMNRAIADPTFWEKIRQDMLAQLRVLANAMGTSLTQMVTDYFLATIVGFVITPKATVVFSHGDGIYMVNGMISPINPLTGNAPLYLAYGLTGTDLPVELKFTLHGVVDTSTIGTLLIGTDGVTELFEVSDRMLPGRREPVGDIVQFYDDHYFANPFAISRRLNIINGLFVPEPGLLHDDSTLIVARRKKE